MKFITRVLRKIKRYFTDQKQETETIFKPLPKVNESIKDYPVNLDQEINEFYIATKLIEKAMKYEGVREIGGSNKGPDVERFQKAVDGVAMGEAWCMCFVQYIVNEVCEDFGIKNPLFPTEHCQTLFDKTSRQYRYADKKPKTGFIFIMKQHRSMKGHTGFCVNNETPVFKTIEGNTNELGSREGDGVYEKTRSINGNLTMEMRGYINAPKIISDAIINHKLQLKKLS